MRVLFATCCLAAIALSASAAEPARPPDPLFQVELLIVRPVTPLGVPEDWSVETGSTTAVPAPGGAEDPEDSADQATPNAEKLAVRTMAPAQFRLGGIAATLERSHNYELIRHVGWTQAATPRGAGLAVEIEDIANDGQPLRGTVALERGRYLHLRVNLTYSPELPPNSLLGATSGNGPVTFAMNQSRRIRSFERHYFDHPAFGVIAMVSPVGGAPRSPSSR
jgi:hypothetical protein